MKSLFKFIPFSAILTGILISSCSNYGKPGTDSDSQVLIDTVTYHADNDISMLVRSILDAIRVGEDLDSLRYTYNAILTDGQGRPLYTDVQNSPGMWQIKTISTDNAVISNLYLGDLLPDHLQQYIVTQLQLDSTAMIKDRLESELESRLVVYDVQGAYLGFESSDTKSKDGREGTLMHIILSAKEMESKDSIPRHS